MKWKHFLSFASGLIVAGCGPSRFHPSPLPETLPSAGELSLPDPGAVESEPYFPAKPLWESRVPGSERWTDGALNSILSFGTRLLEGPEDIQGYCPSYSNLGTENRAGVIAFLVSAIARFESGLNPTARYHESIMGTDTVTGLPVYSEGLLQLSYQDTRWATFCEFDWAKDRNLAATDPRKSIFDPVKNLSCGIRILNRQIEKRGRLVLSTGAYWAVLKSDAAQNKIAAIQALTKELPACKHQMTKKSHFTQFSWDGGLGGFAEGRRVMSEHE